MPPPPRQGCGFGAGEAARLQRRRREARAYTAGGGQSGQESRFLEETLVFLI